MALVRSGLESKSFVKYLVYRQMRPKAVFVNFPQLMYHFEMRSRVNFSFTEAPAVSQFSEN